FRISTAKSDAAVSRFHDLLNREDYTTLISETDEAFGHDEQTAKAAAELFSAIHRKLGMAHESKRGLWRVDVNTSGKFATVQYSTKFDNEEITETFIWRIRGDEMKLVRYNVDSHVLVTK